MLRSIFAALILLALTVGIVTAQRTWVATFLNCEANRYGFEIINFTEDALTGTWKSGQQSGSFTLHSAGSIHLRLKNPRLVVTSNRGRSDIAASIKCGSQSQHRQNPTYLIAALDVPGPATWVCGGYIIIDDNKRPIQTPGQTLRWHGQDIPVTVLILSSYQNPADCEVVDAEPAWYVDQQRYACIAYMGEDTDCPGTTDFH